MEQDLHVVTENGEQCFMWRSNELTYIGQDRQELPKVLASRFGALATKLDLSYNSLTSFENISLFTNLHELVLDNNQFGDYDLDFKQNLRLKTLSLNKNKLTNLAKLIQAVKFNFPNVEFLSLLGNPLCPVCVGQEAPPGEQAAINSAESRKVASHSQGGDIGGGHLRWSNQAESEQMEKQPTAELYIDELILTAGGQSQGQPALSYQKYRHFIVQNLPNLRFLDSAPVSTGERDEALRSCFWTSGQQFPMASNTITRQWFPQAYELPEQSEEFKLAIMCGGAGELVAAAAAAAASPSTIGAARATPKVQLWASVELELIKKLYPDERCKPQALTKQRTKFHANDYKRCACTPVWVLINDTRGASATSKLIGHSSRPKNLALAANKSCDKTIVDACVTTLFVFGRRDVYLPQNFPEMVPHCQEEFDAEDCIKNYARKCFTPFERQVAGMLILGAGQVLRKRCSQEGTKEYLSHYKCIKKTISSLHDAMDQLIYTLISVSEDKDTDIKIPTSCCAFARFQELVNKIVINSCGDFDKKSEDYIGNKMVKGYVSDVLDLSCQGYEANSDKCSKIKLPNGGFEWKNNTLVGIPNAKLPPNKPNSVVLPFLSIFTNL